MRLSVYLYLRCRNDSGQAVNEMLHFFSMALMCFLIACCPSCSSPHRMHHGRRSDGSQNVFSDHQSCVFKRQNSTGKLLALWQVSMWGTLYPPAKPKDSLKRANVEGFCG